MNVARECALGGVREVGRGVGWRGRCRNSSLDWLISRLLYASAAHAKREGMFCLSALPGGWGGACMPSHRDPGTLRNVAAGFSRRESR